jgi:hypothetical protein
METKSQTIEKCPKLPPASYTMLTCHSVINIVMNALTNIVLRGGGGGAVFLGIMKLMKVV